MKTLLVLATMIGFCATPAAAGELFGGVYVHDVDTGLTRSGIEDGVDLELGWRGDRIRFLHFMGSPSPHAFVSLNSEGETHFAAVGISWKLGRKFYLRPGAGIAIHSGSDDDFQRSDRIAFGSRILFEPELGIGYQFSPRLSVEASWVHLSHAQLFGRQNPGLDTIGFRLNYRLH